MSKNILKLLASLPVIFLFLYFIPFLGICLILLRYFMYDNKKKKTTAISLVVVGVLILIPQIVNSIMKLFKLKGDIILSFNEFISNNLYINLVNYSKFLLTVGIIFMIISYVFSRLFDKFTGAIKAYIVNYEKTNAEISRKNDLIIKEKQEKAKNTHVVYCPSCGADNMLVGKVGRCKYCRTHIEYEDISKKD